MESEYASIPLGRLAKLRSGFPFKSADWTESGFPVIKIANVKAGRIVPEGCAFVSAHTAQAAAEWWTQEGDVLIAMTGYVGEVARVRKRERFLINQRVGRFEIAPASPVLAHFLFYALQHPEVRSELETIARGSAQPNLSAKDAERIEIPVPEKAEQLKIVELLAALDDRIDLLRQTNSSLESIAQALFKSWFIDFDPVQAKAEGREPEGMDAATAALFPAGFEESALGLIPKGWTVRSLDSFATYLNGLALQKYPAESEDEYLPVIKIAQLRAGHTNGSDRASARLKPEYVVRDGDVLFSWSGSLEVELWCGGEGALNQHLFKVTSSEVPKWFYYLATKHFLPGFRETAAHKATTMGHIQRGHLTASRLALPPAPVMRALSSVMGPLLERRISGALQARELAAVRDSLLPRLVSGRLRLPEAVEAAEAAAA